MYKPIIATTVGLVLSLNLGGGITQNKAVWFDSLNGFDAILREALTAQAGHVTITDSKEQADITLQLNDWAADEHATTLFREKLGRTDTKMLVGRDRKTGRILVYEPVTPRAEMNRVAAGEFLRKLAELP